MKTFSNILESEIIESEVYIPMSDFEKEDINAIAIHHSLSLKVDSDGDGVTFIGKRENIEDFLNSFYNKSVAKSYIKEIK